MVGRAEGHEGETLVGNAAERMEKTEVRNAEGIWPHLADGARVERAKERLCEGDMLRALAPSVYCPTPERLLARARRYRDDPHAEAFACLRGGEALGAIVLAREGTDAVRILDLGVLAGERHKGVGRALVEHTVRTLCPARLLAETDGDAVDFYRHLGFEVAFLEGKYPGCPRYACELPCEDLSAMRIWCGLKPGARVLVAADEAREGFAIRLARALGGRALRVEASGPLPAPLAALGPEDLVVAAFSFAGFIGGLNRYFSPFGKPEGVAAKYAFLRLGISDRSLAQGLSTPREAMRRMAAEFLSIPAGSAVRVTNGAGTDMLLAVEGFATCEHEITAAGGMAFLPPSEVSASVVPNSARGVIAVDMTVGQLYLRGEKLGEFGLVDECVRIQVQGGSVVGIAGGRMARELERILFGLAPECRKIVELGKGLSDMSPTGLIGVDESIADSCHFGIGEASECGMHLDVVIARPCIQAAGVD